MTERQRAAAGYEAGKKKAQSIQDFVKKHSKEYKYKKTKGKEQAINKKTGKVYLQKDL